MANTMHNTTRAGAVLGFALTLIGQIDAEKLVSAAGVLLSVGSLVVTWALGKYHDARAAKRKEDAEDLKAAAAAEAERLAARSELEKRLADSAERLARVLDSLEQRTK